MPSFSTIDRAFGRKSKKEKGVEDMKKKLAAHGMVDVIILSVLMLVCMFLPQVGYTYKKVRYTLNGLKFLTGATVAGGKATFGMVPSMLIIVLCIVAILLFAIFYPKIKKGLSSGIVTIASIVLIVSDILFANGISDTMEGAKKVGIAYGNIVMMVLGFIVLFRGLYLLWKNKVVSALDFMVIPGMLYFIINNYIPMVGIVIAFKKVNYSKGIFASPWVGFENFKMLFANNGSFFDSNAWIITRNTLLYNVAFIALGTIVGILVGICLADIAKKALQKFFQTSILLPQLISMVIVAYIVYAFFSNETGLINSLLGDNAINFYAEKKVWPFTLIFIYIWKQVGYNAIIFLSSIVGISKEIYEAARVDGATRWQQIRYLTLPLLKPTVITLCMLQVGRIFYSDFGLFYQVPLDSGALYDVTQTIDTYVYRMLMTMNNISVSSAASTYQAIVGFVLVIIVNGIVRRMDKENALF